MYWVIILFVVLVILAPAFYVAIVAQRKGHNEGLWFLYGLMSWPIALIHLEIISKGKHSNQPNDRVLARHPCPYCAELILRQAQVCPNCQRDLETKWSYAGSLGVRQNITFRPSKANEQTYVFEFNGKEYPSRGMAESARDEYIADLRARQEND